MDAVVASNSRFVVGDDGQVYCPLGIYGKWFWERYLDNFERVYVLARARRGDPGENAVEVEGEGVDIIPLPDFNGLLGGARWSWRIRTVVREAVVGRGMVLIARAPSVIATLALKSVPELEFRYGLEVVGDPEDAFSAGAYTRKGRRIAGRLAMRALSKECAHAGAVSYVTRTALQKKYPPRPLAYKTNYSSVVLGRSAYSARSRTPADFMPDGTLRLITVGNFEHFNKGPDIALHALRRAVDEGVSVYLTLVGGGAQLDGLIRLGERLGLGDHVRFEGRVTAGEGVRRRLDESDVFLLPSRQEGLPRALIEAMARGLPAIASDVGGNRELLQKECLVRRDDPVGLSSAIVSCAGSRQMLAALSGENYGVAQDYEAEVLQARRSGFYSEVARLQRGEELHAGGGGG